MAVVAAALWVTAVAEMRCDSQCKPWYRAEPGVNPSPCSAGDATDLRLLLNGLHPSVPDTGGPPSENDVPEEPATNEGFQADTMGAPYKTYFFCPEVDKFSALVMKNSIGLLNSTSNRQWYASVYGAGKSSQVRIPDATQDSVALVWEPSHESCGGRAAAASFLLFNLTLKSGNYAYKNADPIGTGFVPTCEDGKCMLDDSSFCIGAPGRSNCAACVKETTQDMRVLVSYYGTGDDGLNMLSGSSNPLNFRQFAVGNVYSDVRDDIGSIDLPV